MPFNMITNNIEKAKQQLINNNIVAIPTETVYGLAGNAFNEEALKKIFILKKRPFYNPLIVHIKSVDYLKNIADEIPETAIKLANKFWPGPLTLVLKKKSIVPELVTAGKATVAVRVPNHPLTLDLLNRLDFPLAAPSANPFSKISPTCAEHVFNYFEDKLEVILDGGKCKNGIESTIIGFENNEAILYRHGSIAVEEIEKLIGKVKIAKSENKNPTAPGMLTRHYAPITATHLTDNVTELIKEFEGKKIGLLLFKNPIESDSNFVQEILSPKGNLKVAAKKLYAALHRLDNRNLDLIIAEKFPDEALGKTINDRLQRAIK